MDLKWLKTERTLVDFFEFTSSSVCCGFYSPGGSTLSPDAEEFEMYFHVEFRLQVTLLQILFQKRKIFTYILIVLWIRSNKLSL